MKKLLIVSLTLMSLNSFASVTGRYPVSVTDSASCVGTIECQMDFLGNPNLEELKQIAVANATFDATDRCAYWMKETNSKIRRDNLSNQLYTKSFVENIKSGASCFEGRDYAGGYATLTKFTCEAAVTGVCVVTTE